MRIAHISDIHFGRIAHPAIVEVLVEEVNAAGVDLVAVSGDLTQRARRVQFEAAAAMLASFRPPVLVVPGNHDVYAWWYPSARLFRPLARYRRYVTPDLMPSFEREGLAVLGINSAHGRTIKGGRIPPSARRRLVQYFGEQPSEAFRVLVVHHHLATIQALAPHDVARDARRTLDAAARAGVDLVLCGHLHVSHVHPLELTPMGHRIVIASAGTATSNRGRGIHRQVNYYNLIEVAASGFTVEERRFDPDTGAFVEEGRLAFDRVRPPASM